MKRTSIRHQGNSWNSSEGRRGQEKWSELVSESAEGRDQLTGCGAPGNQSTERGGDGERWIRQDTLTQPFKEASRPLAFCFRQTRRATNSAAAGSGDADGRLISEEENKNPGIAQRAFIASAYRCLHFFSLCFKTKESSGHIDGSNFIFSHDLRLCLTP